MTENNPPRWSVKLDATRPADQPGFSDLLPVVNQHFSVHQAVDQFLGPYNAKQRCSSYPYQPPDRDTLRQLVRQGGMNDFSYTAYLNSIIRFCEKHKGQRAMPAPHPSTIHSIQLPLPAFELKHGTGAETQIRVIGTQVPLLVQGLRDSGTVRFIIVRPKLSKLGTASASSWEVLFYRSGIGYIPDWSDSNLNPRFSGIYN
jgi:hypothetical protein